MEKPSARPLTPRQRETLAWVKAFIRENGMPPTVREIGRALEIESSSVFDLLQALERKGFIRRGDLGARSLIIEGEKRQRKTEVPVAGQIAAGAPIEAVEHIRRTLTISKDVLRGREGYALKVQGESMVGAGILDGDYIIVRKQDVADDGDIVVALIGSEATLKRFFRDKRGVRLEPANPKMRPIRVAEGDFRIQGKVVSVMRFMEVREEGANAATSIQKLQRPRVHPGDR